MPSPPTWAPAGTVLRNASVNLARGSARSRLVGDGGGEKDGGFSGKCRAPARAMLQIRAARCRSCRRAREASVTQSGATMRFSFIRESMDGGMSRMRAASWDTPSLSAPTTRTICERSCKSHWASATPGSASSTEARCANLDSTEVSSSTACAAPPTTAPCCAQIRWIRSCRTCASDTCARRRCAYSGQVTHLKPWANCASWGLRYVIASPSRGRSTLPKSQSGRPSHSASTA
mmetsp:Transcript_119066/g.330848  ORF Transcript_119066/g.330848 Transcript_119066/m.330848 type:complete len:233 (-) Transcript_119066:163-861(-)